MRSLSNHRSGRRRGHLLGHLLASLAVIAWAVVSMLPAGTALCLGGGHEWHELIAPTCEHGGHRHGHARRGPQADPLDGAHGSGDVDREHHESCHHSSDDVGPDAGDVTHAAHHASTDCGGCRHHQHDHPTPCTDVPASTHVARVQVGERLVLPDAPPTALPAPPVALPMLDRLSFVDLPMALRFALPDRAAPPRAVTRALRAVVLLV